MALFKKFTKAEEVKDHSKARQSDQRNIRKQIVELYPLLEKEIDILLPKKAPIFVTKTKSYISLVVCNKVVSFFQERDGPFLPTLRTLHKYPAMLPHVQVDKGAIKFILDGANIMCRGLTSAGARMDVDLKENAYCAVMVEGKTHAIGIGRTRLSTANIRKINKDTGVDLIHFLKDDLYKGWQTME